MKDFYWLTIIFDPTVGITYIRICLWLFLTILNIKRAERKPDVSISLKAQYYDVCNFISVTDQQGEPIIFNNIEH